MGWGLGFVWPYMLEKRQLNLGIVDATPVGHSIRGQGLYYDKNRAAQSMENYLSRNSYLSKGEAFTILESYV